MRKRRVRSPEYEHGAEGESGEIERDGSSLFLFLFSSFFGFNILANEGEFRSRYGEDIG
jgi:hypothetical protein